ncbi:MAG: DUF5801 repeats-in-toxin domain-containing protein, partial [Candidatus Pacebacteria bacterium]|nr:DUF5801 repeats-in-toxin domain-containing protein [Candidatus Paceibacterota bacterium]
MARAIGVVKSFLNGTFYVKDSKGSVHQLKVGETINEGDHVYGAANNGASANIVIDVLLDGAGDVVLSANGALQFDSSLLNGIFSHHDAVVYVNSVKDALAMAAAGTEAQGVTHHQPSDGTEAGDKTTAGDETAAGDVVVDTARLADTFAARDGAITDVTTDLRATAPNVLGATVPETPVNLLQDSTPTADWVVAEGNVAVVNEGGLIPEGNLGGNLSTGGTLNITTGGDTINTVGGVVINTVDVTNGGTVHGTYGDLVVTVSGGVYSWTYTLNDNAPHTDPNHTGAADQYPEIPFSMVVTDDDGDSTAPANLVIQINDDGPNITVTGTNTGEGNGLIVDETDLSYNATANFAGNFGINSSYGADGAGTLSTTYSLTIQSSGVDSGLEDVASGQNIRLYMTSGGEVEGRTEVDGDVVFRVSVDGSGTVTLDQIRAIAHPDGSNPNDAVSLAASELISITSTSTIIDKDGDSATDSASINIGTAISFYDDGPTLT